MNERKTEGIVRDILRSNQKKYSKTAVEERQSTNPRIRKLLQHASKSSLLAGSPDFIVTFKEVQDLVIVIECKADVRKHKSKNKDRPKDFAVDGALHYSSYLSREFDVVAIGVSGETKNELLIDNFIQICQERSPRELQANKILDFSDYLNICKDDPRRENLNHDKLMKYSRILNNRLRDDFEFEEHLRPPVVSGILLALEDKGFHESYGKKKTALEVAKLIITTITGRLERDNIGGVKKNTIVNSYKFLETNTKIIQNSVKTDKILNGKSLNNGFGLQL